MTKQNRATTPTITVIAGTNGAGKSSILGEYLRQHGGEYFNPDELARQLREQHPKLKQEDANGLAWSAGRDRLVEAIEHGHDYVFETTLGGNTMPRLLAEAAARGHRLVIWYIGLAAPETHIKRVQSRVQRGGHPISASKIHERFTRSLENLIMLLPLLSECRVFDNSHSVAIDQGEAPQPVSLLYVRDVEMVASIDLEQVPEWAKPVFAACLAEQQ